MRTATASGGYSERNLDLGWEMARASIISIQQKNKTSGDDRRDCWPHAVHVNKGSQQRLHRLRSAQQPDGHLGPTPSVPSDPTTAPTRS